MNTILKKSNTPTPLFTVGIGASAGGLEAIIELLSNVPANSGMAFIVLQHLSPKQKSLSKEILLKKTDLSIIEVAKESVIKANHVYLVSPGKELTIKKGKLSALPMRRKGPAIHSIDHFFDSLAKDQRQNSIGIILSGTGSDGTIGIQKIKSENGITIAQDPKTAKFYNMPLSAIDSNKIDFIFSPSKIAKKLIQISKNPEESVKTASSSFNSNLEKIIQLLNINKNADFSEYKKNTVIRRITRRMINLQIDQIENYVQYIKLHPEELDLLFSNMLIHVTKFFRDPITFKYLGESILPKYLKKIDTKQPLRLWIPACSTGEEAYSFAILIQECIEKLKLNISVNIFATDISEKSIKIGRLGNYPTSIEKDVSEARLKKYFDKTENGYRIKKEVRSMCVFSVHDITGDPPFAKVDMISCRNLLIYFSAELQKKIIPIFHYSLKPQGILCLGNSESVGSFSNYFLSAEKNSRIFYKKNSSMALKIEFPTGRFGINKLAHESRRIDTALKKNELQKEFDKVVSQEYSPPGIIVNDALDILQTRGRTFPFLELSPGQASLNLLKMVRPEIVNDLENAINLAKKENIHVRKNGLSFFENEFKRSYNINVIPLKNVISHDDRMFLIFFEEDASTKKKKETETSKKRPLQEMQKKLTASHEYQQSLVEAYETAQEELETSNEELQSTVEELQSSNEELETSKEEIQSVNEELISVNDELQMRNTEMTALSNDLTNLLNSIDIPILMLDAEGRIKRYTKQAAEIFKLIPTDIGRPFSDLKHSVHIPDLLGLISEVISKAESKSLEIRDENNKCYKLEVQPYRNFKNIINGVVLSLLDIDHFIKNSEVMVKEHNDNNISRDLFIATLSHELRTPLTSILSWAQMILRMKMDENKIKHAATAIEQNALIQGQLIDDLLDLARIQSGKIAFNISEVDAEKVVKAAVDSVQYLKEKKSITIVIHAVPNLPQIFVDPARLQQILWNLLSNAIKFSPNHSTITVIIEKNGAELCIQVVDQGKGISKEFLPKIFRRFSQQDYSSVRAHGGLGLGLSLVNDLVNLQHGIVSVESEGENKGAIFKVCFPAIKDIIIQNPDLNPIEKNQDTDLNGIKVLLVDDEIDLLESIAASLRSYGANVTTALSVSDAYHEFLKNIPDVIISDIAMPKEDGYSLLKKIRALPIAQGGEVPAIAFTAFASKVFSELALKSGFQLHVAKPVKISLLAASVAMLAKKN